MDTIKSKYHETLAATVIKNLEKRQMEGYYCPTVEDAEKLAFSFLKDGQTVSFGGSMTLEETGMLTMRFCLPISGDYPKDIAIFPDGQHLASINHDGSISFFKINYEKGLSSDVYFMSTNAITTGGELVNIDGTGNRVAALIYGPETVVILAGMNKIAANVDEALSRVHNVATAQNCIRLDKKTPCAITGACADCLSPDCICNQVVITRRSGIKGRIKVLLIGESFGY